MVRPKLIEAFNDIREYGVSIDKLIDIHEQVLPLVDQISAILVQAGAEHVQDRIKPGVGLPDDTEVAELITMLVRFRTQAVAAVTATLASSIESTIEELVSRILADYVEKAPIPASRRKSTRHAEEKGAFASARRRNSYSHSIVPGGLLVTSSTTLLTSGTSLVMRVEMRSRTS